MMGKETKHAAKDKLRDLEYKEEKLKNDLVSMGLCAAGILFVAISIFFKTWTLVLLAIGLVILGLLAGGVAVVVMNVREYMELRKEIAKVKETLQEEQT